MIGKVNTGSKSSGGLVPQIIVSAPQGSTITVDFDSYTLTGEEIEHTFVVETGMHQVTATLGTKSKTEMVQVDKIAQFRIELDFKLWLYREGDECEDATGGWSGAVKPSDRGNTLGTVTKNPNSITVTGNGTNVWSGTHTLQNVDIEGYSKLHINVIDWVYGAIQFYNSPTIKVSGGLINSNSLSGLGDNDVPLPSGYTNLNVLVHTGLLSGATITFDKIWLE